MSHKGKKKKKKGVRGIEKQRLIEKLERKKESNKMLITEKDKETQKALRILYSFFLNDTGTLVLSPQGGPHTAGGGKKNPKKQGN